MTPDTFSAECRLVRAEASAAFARLAVRGFLLAEQTGFYPRVRANRDGRWSLGIDFWMTLDERGKYRTEWSRDTPFELSGVGSIDRMEGSEFIRYWKPYVFYASRPYEVALRTLEADVVAVAEHLETWSEQTILETGKRVPIRRSPRT